MLKTLSFIVKDTPKLPTLEYFNLYRYIHNVEIKYRLSYLFVQIAVQESHHDPLESIHDIREEVVPLLPVAGCGFWSPGRQQELDSE